MGEGVNIQLSVATILSKIAACPDHRAKAKISSTTIFKGIDEAVKCIGSRRFSVRM